MKPQTLLLLVVAVGCGLIAMVMTNRLLTPTEQAPATNTVKVLVAKSDLQQGTRLNEQMIELKDWPNDQVPEGAFSDLKEIENRALRYGLGKGTVVRKANLADADSMGGIEAVLNAGQRAVSVGISMDRSVAGFIKPHSHVDIVLIAKKNNRKDASVAKTILQDVEVLAVNTQMNRDGGADNTGQTIDMVTFLLEPEQTEHLLLAQNIGRLSLVLRNNLDRVAVRTRGAHSDFFTAGKGSETRDRPDSIFVNQAADSDDGEPAVADQMQAEAPGWATLLKNMVKSPESAEPPVASEPDPEPVIAPAVVEVPKPVEEPKPPVVAQVEEVVPDPPVIMKRLVIRDEQGIELMTVLLDADHKFVAPLRELLVDHAVPAKAKPAPPEKRSEESSSVPFEGDGDSSPATGG